MNFAALRDELLAKNPLCLDHVVAVNKAEAEYWRRSTGERTAESTDVLGFECGGEQWVLEVALKCGTRTAPDMADVEFVEGLLRRIEALGVPAPAPIEQRWTASSTSLMSPAFSEEKDAIFSWVGIIMYNPSSLSATQRGAITAAFHEYVRDVLEPEMDLHGAQMHWAKAEVPASSAELVRLQQRIKGHFPVEAFNEARSVLDPHNILGNAWLNSLLGDGGGQGGEEQ